MSVLKQMIEDAIASMNKAVPDLTSDDLDYLKNLQQRIQKLKNEPPHALPDGAYSGTLNSEYLRTLRDSLAVYRNKILPMMMKQEVLKLRSIEALAETCDLARSESANSQDSVPASSRPERGAPGERVRGEGNRPV